MKLVVISGDMIARYVDGKLESAFEVYWRALQDANGGVAAFIEEYRQNGAEESQ